MYHRKLNLIEFEPQFNQATGYEMAISMMLFKLKFVFEMIFVELPIDLLIN